MTDNCDNTLVKDMLPDFAGGRLAAGDRAIVEAHLVTCGDCARELAIVRTAAAVFALATPRVDKARIARAIPPRAVQSLLVDERPARRRKLDQRFLQLAAATLVVAAGFGVAQRFSDDRARDALVARAPDLALVGGLDGLDAMELQSLLAGVESLDQAIDVDPDPVTLPVDAIIEASR